MKNWQKIAIVAFIIGIAALLCILFIPKEFTNSQKGATKPTITPKATKEIYYIYVEVTPIPQYTFTPSPSPIPKPTPSPTPTLSPSLTPKVSPFHVGGSIYWDEKGNRIIIDDNTIFSGESRLSN